MLWIWHCTKRLWQYFWECYCQQRGFPEGKHIVWPNAAVVIQTQSRRFLFTSIIVWKTKEKQPVNTAMSYFTSNISESKCLTAFLDLFTFAEGQCGSVVFSYMHGSMQSPLKRLTLSSQMYYWWLTALVYFPTERWNKNQTSRTRNVHQTQWELSNVTCKNSKA